MLNKVFCFGHCQQWLSSASFKKIIPGKQQVCVSCSAKIRASRREVLHKKQHDEIIEQSAQKKAAREAKIEKFASQVDKPCQRGRIVNSKLCKDGMDAHEELMLKRELKDSIEL